MRFTVRCSLVLVVLSMLLLLAAPAVAQVQSNAADLAGVVTDPQGARIPGATVTARNLATNLTRTASTDAEGAYSILALPPGQYEITVESAGFDSQRNPTVELSIGTRSQLNFSLAVQTGQETIIVTAESTLIETQRTAVTETISSRKINNLPINQRDYLNFTLLTSSAARDSAPSIGAAPTSGLNFGGQRGRSNQISVDGADATDNAVNGVRATVSQEAVQEFQMITSGYMPEFGRASGAVINIVTKGGSNELHGNVFGFIRNGSFQADNPFSTVNDPSFTRFQGGVTLGGPIVPDKTFYFFAYERRQKREEGFSSIGAGNFGLIPVDLTALGFPIPVQMTPEQAQWVANTIPISAATAGFYAALVGTYSSTALNRINPGFLVPALAGTPTFFSAVPLPNSYTALNALQGNYPVSEDTDFISGRIDHQWNQDNNFFVRVGISPSDVTGIQVNAQNQTFGQNSYSRSSEQFSDDWSVVAQNVTTSGADWVNEMRGQIADRAVSYTPSSFPGGPGEALGGQGPGVNITGFAFFGREPFSRVDRTERRYQVTDNITLMRGDHTFKFGADLNFIQVRPRLANKQVFELNFGAVVNFSGLGAGSSILPVANAVDPSGTLAAGLTALGAPGITAVQSYGFGVPSSYIQGIGDSFSSFNNTAIGFYAQDSWRVNPNFTLNYGIRWDGEQTPVLPAFNARTQQTEDFLGVVEGIPRDYNNFAPRVGIAWDPFGDGKTAIRAAGGLFYDHPLLAIAFNADTADGAQSTQQILFGGAPCAVSVFANPGCLNATNVFQGILDTGVGDPFNFGYLPDEQRFNPYQTNSIFVNQNFCPEALDADPGRICEGFPMAILPWSIPVAADFEYGYASQWNLTLDRELAKDFSISVGYTGVKGVHLNRPRNINVADPLLLVANLDLAVRAGLASVGTDPRLVSLPINGNLPGCVDTLTGSINLVIPGIFGIAHSATGCNAADTIGVVGLPAAFNFFRPTGPNLAFTGGLGVPDAGMAGVIALARGSFGLPYPEIPGFFPIVSDVNQQESTGSSIYHGATLNLRKRYSDNYEFLASYTWSHAIDDSTDLQTLLNPQDNAKPDLERSSSTFDQRHRFVFSMVYDSPFSMSDEGFTNKFLADWVIAPIFEASSGRPYSVLTGSDVNLDFGSNTDRPSLVPVGTAGSVTSPFIDGAAFLPPTVCPVTTNPSTTLFFGCTGNLGRNTFTRPGIWFLNLRLARKFKLTEDLDFEAIADGFNMFNRFNIADVNPLCDPIGGRCIAGQPTAAFDSRQFQFGFKLSW